MKILIVFAIIDLNEVVVLERKIRIRMYDIGKGDFFNKEVNDILQTATDEQLLAFGRAVSGFYVNIELIGVMKIDSVFVPEEW